MSDKFEDRLAGYIEVKDRIAALYELYGDARITTAYELTREPDDKPKVIARALVYRNADDPHPATGTSWLYLPGTTPYTKGSEIENAETSAVGRAIGMLGILIDRSIASANEVESKKQPTTEAGRADAENTQRLAERANEPDAPILDGPVTVIGRIVVGRKPQNDGLIRETPDGPVMGLSFEDTEGKSIPQVIVRGPLAVDLYDAAGDSMHGLLATVSGDLYRVPWKKDGKPMRPFQRLHLERIVTSSWTLPEPEPVVQTESEAEFDAIADSLGLVPDGAA